MTQSFKKIPVLREHKVQTNSAEWCTYKKDIIMKYDVSHEYVRFISKHGMEVTFPLFQSTAKHPVVSIIDQRKDDACGHVVAMLQDVRYMH